jgi:hypothetical protein
MPSSEMLLREALIRTDVAEELSVGCQLLLTLFLARRFLSP